MTREPASAAASSVDVAARLGIAATRLARMLRQQDVSQLTPTMRAALGTIEREGPITLGDLALREQVAPPTITKVVGRLEEGGFVTRVPDDEDRRVCRVELSDGGRRRLEADRRRRRAWLATRIDHLPEAERARLTAALSVIESLTVAPGGSRR